MDKKYLEDEIYDKCGEFNTVYDSGLYKIVETEMNEDGQISFITVGLSNNIVNIQEGLPEIFSHLELNLTIDSSWLNEDYDSNKIIKTLVDLADFIISDKFIYAGFGTRFDTNGTVYDTFYSSFFLYFSLNLPLFTEDGIVLQIYPIYKEEETLFQTLNLDIFTKYYFNYKHSSYKRANLHYVIKFDDINLYKSDESFILPSMFFSWMILNDLVSDEFKETNTDLLEFVSSCNGYSDLREVVKENLNIIYSPFLYNTIGIDFALFYTIENEAHNLINDAIMVAKEVEHREIDKDTRDIFINYSDELIKAMYDKFDSAYKEYNEINYFDGYNYGEEQ